MAVDVAPAVGELIWLKLDELRPNTWNPNEMDEEKLEKERTSISRFGMILPIVARENNGYEIIDGENRWNVLAELGHELAPVFNLGTVPDAKAQQMTIVLNELRGEPNREKLGTLLKGLLASETTADLLEVLPFSDDDFKDLVELPEFDWGALDQPTPTANPSAGAKWVERTFRLPPDAAEVVDEAIHKAQKDEDDMADWQALEAICADYMGGP